MKYIFLIAVTLISLGLQAHEGTDGEQLKLDQGKKWIANEATHVGMTAIDKLLKSASDNETLVADLQKEIQSITSQCTMTGPAHDQLHIVLIPIIEQTAALGSAKNADRQQHLDELKHLTHAYFKHFKTAAN